MIYAYFSSNNPNRVIVEKPIATSTEEIAEDKETEDEGVVGGGEQDSDTQAENVVAKGWQEVQIKNINDGKNFRISDFEGAHVMLESFAIWCSTCLKQQNEVKKARVAEVDQVIHIGLNTDPNEDEARVKSYINEHDFDWLYAVAPKAMTDQLIDEFGFGIVNAPQAPMIHICPDGSAKLLKRGLKSAEDLNAQVDFGCEG